MQHFVRWYSDSELILAVTSPYLTDYRKAEVEAEILRRKFAVEELHFEVQLS
jgi:hypothetical protein